MYFDPTIFGGMATGMGAMLDQMESLSRKNRENQRYNSFQNTNLNQIVAEYNDLVNRYNDLNSAYFNLEKKYFELLCKIDAISFLHSTLKNGKFNTFDMNLARDWAIKGNKLWNEKKYLKAINAWQRAILHDPENPEYWLQLGNAYRNLGEEDGERSVIIQAIKLDTNIGEAFPSFYAILLANEGKYEEALIIVEKAISHSPNNPQYWQDKGGLLELMGRHSEAKIAYAKATSLR